MVRSPNRNLRGLSNHIKNIGGSRTFGGHVYFPLFFNTHLCMLYRCGWMTKDKQTDEYHSLQDILHLGDLMMAVQHITSISYISGLGWGHSIWFTEFSYSNHLEIVNELHGSYWICLSDHLFRFFLSFVTMSKSFALASLLLMFSISRSVSVEGKWMGNSWNSPKCHKLSPYLFIKLCSMPVRRKS